MPDAVEVERQVERGDTSSTGGLSRRSSALPLSLNWGPQALDSGPNGKHAVYACVEALVILRSFSSDSVKVRDVIRALLDDGWELVATRGSHRQYRHPTKQGP